MLKVPAQSESKAIYKPRVHSYQVWERVLSRSFDISEEWKFRAIKSKLGSVIYMVQSNNGKVIKRHYNQLGLTKIRKSVSFNPNPVVQHYPQQRSSSQLAPRPSKPKSRSQLKQRVVTSTPRTKAFQPKASTANPIRKSSFQ